MIEVLNRMDLEVEANWDLPDRFVSITDVLEFLKCKELLKKNAS